MTILVVDDNSDNLYQLQVLLPANGFEVVAAVNGAEALQKARDGPPDLIIADILMPVMDGFALCREWKRDARLRSIPFIFYTATYTDERDRQLALDLGAERFLVKPEEPEVLVQTLREVLAERQEAGAAGSRPAVEEEAVYLKEYNQALIRKLEDKVAQLEAARSELEHDFAALQRADLALRESETRYRRLHESMTDAFVLVDMPGRILETNRAYETMLGYDADELSRMTYRDLTPQQWRAFEADIVAEEVLPLGHSRVYEKELRRKDGTVFPVELRTFLLRGEAGDPAGMWSIVRDIAERKSAEAELRLHTLLLTTQQEASIDGILVVSGDAEIVSFNQRFVDMWGIPLEVISQRSDGPLLRFSSDQVADSTTFLDRVEYLHEHPREISRDEVCLRDGRTFDRYSAPMVGWDDHYYGRVWSFRDITERKRAEESNARLATAVEQAAEAIVITDVGGSIVYANPSFERTSGYARDEAIGKNPRFLKSGKQDAEFYREMWAVLSQGGVWRGHLINKRKDGTLFEEDATITPVRDAAGNIVDYVAVKHDVSNEMRLEQQLFQAQKMEAVGRLAAGVAHDFNNLLGVITGYGDIVRSRLPEGDPLKGKMEQILKAADRAAGLTRQLLAFGRKQVLQPKILDVNIVVSDMEKMLRRLIGEDVAFTTRLEPGLGGVRADQGQIEQVLMNLAVNARDAMPEGGQIIVGTCNSDLDAPCVSAHQLVPAGRYVVLAMTDTGSGIDPVIQTQMFEPFFTTKGVGKGTGLGLATVHGIVRQSDGFIWVDSELGVGTTFKVFLPRLDEEASTPRQESRGPLPRGHETVLLVEDEEALRQLLQETLETHGYSVLVAQDAADAARIAKVHSGPIDLMVTDVIMPGMIGPRIVDLIAPTRPEMKVQFISGYSDEAVARHGLAAPGRAFISKPFSPETLLRQIRELLDANS